MAGLAILDPPLNPRPTVLSTFRGDQLICATCHLRGSDLGDDRLLERPQPSRVDGLGAACWSDPRPGAGRPVEHALLVI